MKTVSNWKNILIHYEDGSSEESNVNDLLAQEKNKFKGWMCWAGVQNLTIDNEGNVWRAICRVGGKLGNIYEGFEIPATPIVCTKESCTCAADIQISKAKINEIGQLRVGNEQRS
jgi:hypothetical protein